MDRKFRKKSPLNTTDIQHLNYYFDELNFCRYFLDDIIVWSKEVKKRIQENKGEKLKNKNEVIYKLFKESFVFSNNYLEKIKCLLAEEHLSDTPIIEQDIDLKNEYKQILGDWSKPLIGGYKTKDKKYKHCNLLVYVSQTNTSTELWSEFVDLLFKWNFPKYSSFSFLYDFLNIHTHPLYLFLSCCIVFKLETIDDPARCLHEDKTHTFGLGRLFSKYKWQSEVLDGLKKLLDDPKYDKKDIKKYFYDSKPKYLKEFMNSGFFYPGKLPSKTTWIDIWDDQKRMNNVIEGQRSGQINKKIRNFKMYLARQEGNSDTCIINKYLLINEKIKDYKDRPEKRSTIYQKCNENINNLKKDLGLI